MRGWWQSLGSARTPDRRSGAAACLFPAAIAVTVGCGGSAAAVLIGGSAGLPAVAVVALVDLAVIAVLTRPGRDAATDIAERLERGFHDAAIGMTILTTEPVVTRVNNALCTLLGRRAEELVGHSIIEFTAPEDVGRSLEKRETMLGGAGEHPLDKRYLRPDGTVVEALVIATLVEPDGAEPYFFSQLQDVTEQRRGERQRAAIADLGHSALERADAIVLMGEAMTMVRSILGTAACITTRRLTSGDLRLVAADGDGLDMRIPAGRPSQSVYTLELGEPVISNDLLEESRFTAPPVIMDNGLRRCVSVPVPPDEFVYIAEETGLIVPIGSWVLRTVCSQLARWPEAISVAANLSPVQIRPELVREVAQHLAS